MHMMNIVLNRVKWLFSQISIAKSAGQIMCVLDHALASTITTVIFLGQQIIRVR
jgi:hypothetical protein